MKLLTKAIAEQLYQNDRHVIETGESPELPVVKFFDPQSAATWYVTSGTPLDADNGDPIDNPDEAKDWHLFGFCTLGDARCAEYGYTLFSTLRDHRSPIGMKIERDLGFNPALHPMKEIVATIKEGGHV